METPSYVAATNGNYPEWGFDSRPGALPSAAHAMASTNPSQSANRPVSFVALEPQAQALADAAANPPYVFHLGPVDGRRLLVQAQGGVVPRPDVTIEDKSIQGGLVGEVSIRIVRPREAVGELPVIVYLHGGGWVLGDHHTHDRLIREFADRTGAAVVFPNYSRSPEECYPTAVEESYAALRHVAERGVEHGLDGSRLAVAGDSAGGNIAAALTLLAKERAVPAIAAQVLLYPITDAAFDTASYRQFATGYHLRRDEMQWFWDQYAPDHAQRQEVTASPLRATLHQLAGLPPALVVTAEADVLRDEGEAYAAKLRLAGVRVTAVRYAAIVHDFVMLDALRESAAALAATAQAAGYLRQALGLPSRDG